MKKSLFAIIMLTINVSAQAEILPQEHLNNGKELNDVKKFEKIKDKIIEIKKNQLNNAQLSLNCTQLSQNINSLRACQEQDRKNHEEKIFIQKK